jgi:glycosyltransferase involved in cell wall biosynthesis
MRIGFEASSLITDKPAGIARYTTRLIPAILNENTAPNDVVLFYKASRMKYRRHWWRLPGVRTRVYQGSYWPIRKQVDILHGMDGFVPNWKRSKRIITIHDLAAIKLESEHVASQQFQSRKLAMFRQVRDYVDAVITVSEATKQDVIDILNIAPDRIHVAHLGVDAGYAPQDREVIDQVLSKYGIRQEYLLFVGSVSGRKNTARLVDAFAESKASRYLELVLAGAISYRGEDTLEAVKRNHLEERVALLDYVTDSDLPALYSGARGFVFPTLYEGFGLPILEAMACGTPVLTSNLGSAPEIGDKWAILVDPYDTDDIASGIDRLLEYPPEQKESAIAHAGHFTWERCARRTLAVYEQLMKG